MAGLLLLFDFLLLIGLCARSPLLRPLGGGWRGAFLYASVIAGSAIVMVTECANLLSCLSLPSFAVVWGVVGIGLLMCHRCLSGTVRGSAAAAAKNTALLFPGILMGAFFLATGIIALVAPPNTSDSLAYHLSRVFQWEQNRSLSPFPTSDIRQLLFPPGAEYLLLQVQVLTGTDRFVNLIQWMAYGGCALGISLIAQQLGVSWAGQAFAALACVMLPQAILQASSTQNDLLVAYWMVCFVWGLLCLRSRPSVNFATVLFTGAALGLALLTKGTAYLYALPYLGMYVVEGVSRPAREVTLTVPSNLPSSRQGVVRGWIRPKWGLPPGFLLLLVCAVAVLLNSGYYLRTHALVGSVYSRPDIAAGFYGADLLASNLIRNTAVHFGVPSPAVNATLMQGTRALHRYLGVEVDDQRSTLSNTQFSIGFSLHEDRAGNPLHAVLFLFLPVWLLTIGRGRQSWSRPVLYALSLGGGMVLLCLCTRWSPWNIRYHVPLFVLGTALFGLPFHRESADVSQRRSCRRFLSFFCTAVTIVAILRLLLGYGILPAVFAKTHAVNIAVCLSVTLSAIFLYGAVGVQERVRLYLLGILFSITALPALLFNQSRPLIGKRSIFNVPRLEQYFANRPERYDEYRASIDFVLSRGCTSIGLKRGKGDWEYPFVVFLRTQQVPEFRLRHVMVANPPVRSPQEPFSPCGIIVTKAAGVNRVVLNGVQYSREWARKELSVFVRP